MNDKLAAYDAETKPRAIAEWFLRIHKHADAIFVREGTETVPLSSVPDERWLYWVAKWLRDGGWVGHVSDGKQEA